MKVHYLFDGIYSVPLDTKIVFLTGNLYYNSTSDINPLFRIWDGSKNVKKYLSEIIKENNLNDDHIYIGCPDGVIQIIIFNKTPVDLNYNGFTDEGVCCTVDVNNPCKIIVLSESIK